MTSSNRRPGTARVGAIGVALLVTMGACATSQNPIYGPGDVDQPPELYGCPTIEVGAGPTIDLEVAMVIDAEGGVESARYRPTTRSGPGDSYLTPPDDLVRRAENTARNCQFAPAVRNGQPVRYRLVRTFTFSFQPERI